MPSIFETITRAVVHELDAGGETIAARSIIDADRFRCFCLVTGKRSLLGRRHYYSTGLTLEDILEREEDKEQFEKLDSGPQGQRAEFKAVDQVDSTVMSEVKLPKDITIEGSFQESHEHNIMILVSRIPQKYLNSLQNRKLKSQLPPLFLSMQRRGEDLYLVTETLETTKEETLKNKRQFTFWNQLNFLSLKYERKHHRTVTIPRKTVLGYRIKQLFFPNMERMNICFSGKTKSFPEEEGDGSSCLGKSLSLVGFRNMKEMMQDTVRDLQDLTEKEREDMLSCLTKCLTEDKQLLQDLEGRVSEVLTSGELQMEGPGGHLMSSLFNAAGILVKERGQAILDFLDALKELSEEKELIAETLRKGTLPLLKDQVESILVQNWGEDLDVDCDPEAQIFCALYVAVSILLQLSEKPASVSSC
ncbi:PREDICTED: gasdermin-B [Miniopterus natalensis]|uniref:gasdermin-B n=1 Tax=Miniopterus natalensis TaxID=291302 RepID=UPI0007A70F1D|nr:PREDICTED: gasdermin-B [Miniopterus natalensis]